MTSLAYSNFEVTGPAGVAGALNVGGRWESGLELGQVEASTLNSEIT